ncbi:hypothetical protein D3C78_1357090 [compost metagenome]
MGAHRCNRSMIKNPFCILNNGYACLTKQLLSFCTWFQLPNNITGAPFNQFVYGTNGKHLPMANNGYSITQELDLTE